MKIVIHVSICVFFLYKNIEYVFYFCFEEGERCVSGGRGGGEGVKERAKRFGGGPEAFLCDRPGSMPNQNGSSGLEGHRHCDTQLV